MSPDLLPDFTLTSTRPATRLCTARGIGSYREAARHLQALPYGRNADRAAWRLVLDEGRGTCSTKHALLASVAAEHEQPVELVLGIYAMSESNTPAVGRVLERYNLPSIPEAHCYLRYHGERVDLTWPVGRGLPFVASLLSEQTIAPEEIGEFKLAAHRHAIAEWLRRRDDLAGWTVERVWEVRERCIAALAAAM